jgi:hypothetical protein
MAVRITPEEFAEKHARRLKASLPDMQAGVLRVTKAPTEQAAAKQDKMLANLTASVQSGKWARGLRRVSLSDWQQKFIDKGLNRVAAGIDGAKDKQVAFATQLFAHENAILAKIEKMPDMTLEDSIQRMTTFTREMAKFKGQ